MSKRRVLLGTTLVSALIGWLVLPLGGAQAQIALPDEVIYTPPMFLSGESSSEGIFLDKLFRCQVVNISENTLKIRLRMKNGDGGLEADSGKLTVPPGAARSISDTFIPTPSALASQRYCIFNVAGSKTAIRADATIAEMAANPALPVAVPLPAGDLVAIAAT